MSLGANLRSLRVSSGQSLQDVADAVGISKPHLWQLERGDSKNPTLDVMQGLAKHFQTTISIMLGEDIAIQSMIFGREVTGEFDDATKEMIVQMAKKLGQR